MSAVAAHPDAGSRHPGGEPVGRVVIGVRAVVLPARGPRSAIGGRPAAHRPGVVAAARRQLAGVVPVTVLNARPKAEGER